MAGVLTTRCSSPVCRKWWRALEQGRWQYERWGLEREGLDQECMGIRDAAMGSMRRPDHNAYGGER
jgi:hypothetical protein